ncbi:nmrA-like family domain-containing protein 1 [Aspergillus udagawae]|nr:nmrA-like family domain-containing protein 1 [Aspergillus udagawae]
MGFPPINGEASVAHTFLDTPNWTVRAITRNPASTKAQALAAAGAELFQADLNDIASLEAAFQGAHSIFVNTDFWGPYLRGTGTGSETTHRSDDAFNEEVRRGKNAAIAASRVPTLERFVYSALGPTKRALKGKRSLQEDVDYLCWCLCDESAHHADWTPGRGLYKFIPPVRGETKIPIIDTPSSTGPFVHALVEHELAGINLLAYDSYLSINEVVDIWAKAMGKKAELVTVTAQHMQLSLIFRGRPRTKTFGEWLAGRIWEEVLDGGHAELHSFKEPGTSA